MSAEMTDREALIVRFLAVAPHTPTASVRRMVGIPKGAGRILRAMRARGWVILEDGPRWSASMSGIDVEQGRRCAGEWCLSRNHRHAKIRG